MAPLPTPIGARASFYCNIRMNPLQQPILFPSHTSDESKQVKEMQSRSRFTSFRTIQRAPVTSCRSYFDMTGKSATWTLADERRLQSIDALHTRLLEFHNNVHVRCIDEFLEQQMIEISLQTLYDTNLRSIYDSKNTLKHNTNGGAPTDASSFNNNRVDVSTKLAAAILSGADIVAQVCFAKSGSKNPKSLNQNGVTPLCNLPTPLSRESLDNFLNLIRDSEDLNEDIFLWIHVTDRFVLKDLAIRYDIHELCLSGFADFRAHSSFIPVAGGCFVSFCTFVMIGTDISMTKVFAYLSKGLCITYEKGIHPVASCSVKQQSIIVARVVEKYNSLLLKLLKHGPVYLLYSLAHHALILQDSIIDFFSRTLYYFKQMVHTRLHHRDKLKIHRKMHIIGKMFNYHIFPIKRTTHFFILV